MVWLSRPSTELEQGPLAQRSMLQHWKMVRVAIKHTYTTYSMYEKDLLPLGLFMSVNVGYVSDLLYEISSSVYHDRLHCTFSVAIVLFCIPTDLCPQIKTMLCNLKLRHSLHSTNKNACWLLESKWLLQTPRTHIVSQKHIQQHCRED